MDPNNLDPKLKETYERVMGTQTATAQQTPAAPQASNPVNPITTNPTTTGPVIPTEIPQGVPTPAYTQDNLNFQAAIQTPIVGAAAPVPAVIVPQHHSSSLLKILYIIGAIVFFLAYTFLWIKIFKLPIPFLN